MTSSVIQWDDDWFSVGEEGENGKKDLSLLEVQEPQDQAQPQEQAKAQPKEQVQPKEKAQPQEQVQPPTIHVSKPDAQEKEWKWRIEVLEALVQQQDEQIKALEKDVLSLKQRPSPPSPVMSRVSITQLLEEWKLVKQRELNYALRRHQPVPFLSVDSWLKWEQATGSPASKVLPLPTSKVLPTSKDSPLFRYQVMKEWEKERETREKEEKEMEALMRGLDAIKL